MGCRCEFLGKSWMVVVVKPNKSLGQHWLSDQSILEKIASYAEIDQSDNILEIGPGLGTLTGVLASKAKKVMSVEIDEELFQKLNKDNKLDNLEFVNQDILKFDLNLLPKDYKLVANIPYYLTSHLIRILVDSPNPPSKIVLLIQKEVAERITAKPGSMSILSAVVQFYYVAESKDIVLAKMFTPPPKVDSQIITMTRRKTPIVKVDDSNNFFRLIKVGFSARRKILENSLSAGLRLDKEVIRGIINSVGLAPLIRPQMLSIGDWGRLYREMKHQKLI
jgi:16S rRNA (adenine1518-N6/adenine1519-N6)-dimethyltransferase